MRLIDADALIQVLCVNMDTGQQFDRATHCVDEMPTVDAVPVIRCKDCRYIGRRMESGYYTCRRKKGCVETIPEGFCGWAVPKMGEVEE